MAKRRNERGRLFLRGKSKRWYCQYYVDRKQVIARLLTPDGKPCANREQAIAARDRLLAPLFADDRAEAIRQVSHALEDATQAAAAIVEAGRPRMAIANAWDRFAAAPNRPQCGAVTLRDYKQRWAKFAAWMKANAGAANMETVTPEHVSGFVRSLAELSPNRYNKIVETCRLVFRILAAECGNVNNPFANVAHRQLDTHGHRELSEGELAGVCRAAAGELRLLLALGLYTALRLKDCVLLRWESVNLETGRIMVTPAKTRRIGKTLVIPLHATLAGMLAETPLFDRRGYVLPATAEKYQRDPTAIVKGIRRHLEACGIETREKHPGQKIATCAVGFHSLRHSFVSLCARANVPLAIVQELAGHSSPAIQRHYLHMGETATRQAIAALPKLATGTRTLPAAVAAEKAARERLHALADSLPVEAVQRLLASMEGKR